MHQRSQPRFDVANRAFHWLTAAVVTVAFILGPGGFGRLVRQGIDPATRSDIVWHESLGAVVFVSTVLRLIWIAGRPTAHQFQMAARHRSPRPFSNRRSGRSADRESEGGR